MENKTKKVAVLVETTLKTRVVVDVPNDWDEKKEGNIIDAIDGETLEDIADFAKEHYYIKIMNGETLENIVSITNDLEVPYDAECEVDSVEKSINKLYDMLEGGKVAKLNEIEYPSGNGGSSAVSISLVDREKGIVRIGYEVCGFIFAEDRNMSELLYTDFLNDALWDLDII